MEAATGGLCQPSRNNEALEDKKGATPAGMPPQITACQSWKGPGPTPQFNSCWS